MKNFNLIYLILFSSYSLICQLKEFNLNNYFLFNYKVKGINSKYLSDYAARLLEKNDVAIFAAFDTLGSGYVIVEKEYQGNECKKFLENAGRYNFTVISYEKMNLTEDLYLSIYQLRNNLPLNEPPKFIQLGPKTELSNLLYNKAKDIWIKKFPEKYKEIIKSNNK